jgi:S-formylglutathione hydrolase FrmB
MRRSSLLLSLFLLSQLLLSAARIDTLELRSPSMHKLVRNIVIIPGSYDSNAQRYPVVYLLHGAGGDFSNWPTKDSSLGSYADHYQVIIVCPDGGSTSWYFDSPVDSTMRYETYISNELLYRTIASKAGRAITGLSMGGHGALYLSFRHPGLYAAAASMSGGVDIRPFPKNWELAKRLGTYESSPQNWENHSVTNLLPLLKDQQLAILFDCGTDDFFYTVNKALHEKMLEQKIPHTYTERPGTHNWAYWKNALPYHLLFFNDVFNRYRLHK